MEKGTRGRKAILSRESCRIATEITHERETVFGVNLIRRRSNRSVTIMLIRTSGRPAQRAVGGTIIFHKSCYARALRAPRYFMLISQIASFDSFLIREQDQLAPETGRTKATPVFTHNSGSL